VETCQHSVAFLPRRFYPADAKAFPCLAGDEFTLPYICRQRAGREKSLFRSVERIDSGSKWGNLTFDLKVS
jgi:hypothetical protein